MGKPGGVGYCGGWVGGGAGRDGGSALAQPPDRPARGG